MTILFIFIPAFLVRLINLNQSLWLDEAIVAKVVRTIPLLQIPFQFSIHDFHPPLYYMVMSLWATFFGSSEIALRMPSVLFSLIAGFYVYKMGFLLKDKKTAVWAATFFLFNPLIIYYSQEARMYMMATAFLTGALYYFLRVSLRAKQVNAKQSQRDCHVATLLAMTESNEIATAPVASRNDIILFNIFSALAMFTFYGSAFFIAGMILTYVISTERSEWRDLSTEFTLSSPNVLEMTKKIVTMTWGLFISLLLLSPLLLQQLNSAKMGLEVVKNWSLVLGKAELKNFLMIFLKFATGRLSWYPKWSYYAFAGLSSLIIWSIALLGMRKNKALSFLFLFPLGVGLVVSFFTPMMMYFRFLYLIPVMSLLLGINVIPTKQQRMEKSSILRFLDGVYTELAERARNDATRIVIISIFLLFSFLYLFNPQFHREDWKKMVDNINPTRPVFMILPSSDPLSYYDSSLTPFEIRNMQETALPEYIQVIPYVEELYGYNHEEILKKKECILESRSTYRGPLILENWKCPGERLALQP